MTVKHGWQGRCYEDFTVGDIYPHALGRTITDVDNIWFTLLTVNPNPIHFDQAYAERTPFKKLLVDSTFTLALVTGLSVADVSQNAINLGWEHVRLPQPVCAGDTLRAWSEVLEARLSQSRPEMGIVRLSRPPSSTRRVSRCSSLSVRSWSTGRGMRRKSRIWHAEAEIDQIPRQDELASLL